MKTSLVLLALALTGLVARATVTENFQQTYPLAADGTVRVDNVNGFVEIIAWDKAEISLEAEKRAPDEDSLKRIHLDIEASPTELSVKTRYEKRWSLFGNTRGEVRYKLMVPAGASLKKIDVVNSNIRVRGVKGYVYLDSVNGGIDASGLISAGRFETVNGSIEVAYDRLPANGDISLDTVNGSVRVTVPKDAAFALNADSVNGRIHCDLPVTLEKTGHHHLRGTVAAGGPHLSLESVNGSLHVNAK